MSKRATQDVSAEIIARFHALLGNEEPLTLSLLEPFFSYLATQVCYNRDVQHRYTFPVDERRIAGELFKYGCVKLKLLDQHQANKVVDALITNHLPDHAWLYQLFTYILRLEKYECGGYLRMMMPLFALTDTKWYPLHPYRSDMLVNVIQAFSICTIRYTSRSIQCYDTLDLLAKLKRIINGVVSDQRYQGDAYLGYTLDSLRYVAIAYLGIYVLRTTQNRDIQEQANRMLNRLIVQQQSVINTHITHHTNQGG